ncbi:ATP-binding protein [Alteromonadaceae bacterium BrNp21-10]|nr:ATP-binding protein [Alteromonadaceae bacterium BrNp21-10]
MARLFISLYLVIATSLILLAASLDNVFFEGSPPTPPSAIALSDMLRYLHHNPHFDLADFSVQTQLPTQWLSENAIAFPAEQAAQLAQGQPVILHAGSGQQQIYLLLDKRILEVSVPVNNEPTIPYFLYSSVFFVLLSIPLALWIWPLWRDLNQLKRSAQSLQADGSLVPVTLSQHSPLKTIADAFNQLGEQIKQLLQSQRELTGAVAHEFRTPLARLKFALALKPKEGSGPWDAMNNDVDELERLIQEMLDYASMESTMPDMDMSEIPLKQLCQQVMAKFPHHQHINLTLEGDKLILLADGYFIQRALQNLIQNALRYAQSQVQINLSQTDTDIIISVDDDGPGVDSKDQQRIFDPFYRPDSSRDRQRGGAGLGLTIVRRIQHWHQGQCWVETSPLGGARFVLRYPQTITDTKSVS